MSASPDELAVRALQRPRPRPDQLLNEWQRYFADPLLSLAALKADAEQGVLHDKRGLRSLSWRYFLGLLPAPTPSPTTPTSREPYELTLAQSRTAYTALRERYLRSPDGRWVADGPGDAPATAGKGQARVEDLKVNNPLGLDDGNPWQEWFADLETRSEIRKDVLRTFPEIDYFRSAETQDRMTDLLFIWCKLAPEVGYRQGMHELLAPLLWFVDYDSLPMPDVRAGQGVAGGDNELAHLVLAREWVEHDTWALFAAVMQSAKVFYDHTPSVTLTPRSSSAFHAPAHGLSQSSSALVQPVVALSSHLQSLLSTVDPPLARAFTALQVEPQLYAIRWFRLLFSREFPLPATLTLWDALLATDGTSLRLVTHIALALLLRARDALVRAAADGDYGTFVQLLLRYPACADGEYATALLVRQALHLRDNCSPESARHVRRENAALGRAIGEPLTDDELVGEPVEASTPYGARAAGAPSHRRAQTVAPVNGLGFFGGEGLVFGDLAKGVLAKSEALGINKALRGTYDEIKRGVAEAQSLAEERRRAARLSPSASGFSQIPQRAPWGVPSSSSPTSPVAAPADPHRSPPPPPVAAKDALADLEAMRRASAGMSAAIARAVDVLERAVGPDRGQEDEVKAALDALRHVGDVLGGRADGFIGTASQGSQTVAAATPDGARAQPSSLPAAVENGGTRSERPSTLTSASSSTSPHVDAATPSRYLGARTDKPLPSLSRPPQTPSPALPPPPPPPPSSQGSPAYPPAPASSAASYPPSPVPAPPRSPAVAPSPPPPASTFPSSSFSTRPSASRPPAPASLDPLGALSSL
ncbi:hypothetical protein JCM8208_007049 [Rhodotorula glutinis]